MKLSEKLWVDLKTDAERASWLRMGRGYETGIVASAIQQELAMAYERLVGYQNAVEEEREACAKVCEAQVPVYLKDGERWLRGVEGKPDTRLKELAPHLEAAWEAEQLLKNGSGIEWITQAHECAAAIRARGGK